MIEFAEQEELQTVNWEDYVKGRKKLAKVQSMAVIAMGISERKLFKI